MIDQAATPKDALWENSLRIDAQFPYFAKILSENIASAMEVSEPLIEILGSNTDELLGHVFRDAMTEAVTLLNHPLIAPLIADTVQQVCDFFVAEYFTLSEKSGAEFAEEALNWINARKDARYERGRAVQANLREKSGAAVENQ